jgi:hypothetical protein
VTLRLKPAAIGVARGAWLVAAWLFASTDRFAIALSRLFLRGQDRFHRGVSEDAFRTIASGQSDEEIRRLLGTPYGQGWLYQSRCKPTNAPTNRGGVAARLRSIRFEKGVVLRLGGRRLPGALAFNQARR